MPLFFWHSGQQIKFHPADCGIGRDLAWLESLRRDVGFDIRYFIIIFDFSFISIEFLDSFLLLNSQGQALSIFQCLGRCDVTDLAVMFLHNCSNGFQVGAKEFLAGIDAIDATEMQFIMQGGFQSRCILTFDHHVNIEAKRNRRPAQFVDPLLRRQTPGHADLEHPFAKGTNVGNHIHMPVPGQLGLRSGTLSSRFGLGQTLLQLLQFDRVLGIRFLADAGDRFLKHSSLSLGPIELFLNLLLSSLFIAIIGTQPRLSLSLCCSMDGRLIRLL